MLKTFHSVFGIGMTKLKVSHFLFGIGMASIHGLPVQWIRSLELALVMACLVQNSTVCLPVCLLHGHCLPVQWIWSLQPEALIMVGPDLSLPTEGSRFVERVRACMDFYYPFFEATESLVHAGERKTLRVAEELFSGSHLGNILSCEGGERVVRPESARDWVRRLAAVGLLPRPVDPRVKSLVDELLRGQPVGFGTLTQDHVMAITWNGIPHIFAGAWAPASMGHPGLYV